MGDERHDGDDLEGSVRNRCVWFVGGSSLVVERSRGEEKWEEDETWTWWPLKKMLRNPAQDPSSHGKHRVDGTLEWKFPWAASRVARVNSNDAMPNISPARCRLPRVLRLSGRVSAHLWVRRSVGL